MNKKTRKVTGTESSFLSLIELRFKKNMHRHKEIAWADVKQRLEMQPEKLCALMAMESTGGEPDVISMGSTESILFADCSAESPAGRRSLCYDEQALKERKAHKPAGSAMGMAVLRGFEMMTASDYHFLQQFGNFDTKTSSWLKTPDDIRQQGGAIFGDYRYGHMFIYHNSAQSYYASRGFRALLRL